MSLLFLTIPAQLLAIFGLQDPVVVELGKQLLRYLSISGFFITVALTYTGGLQGTGDTRSPLYITLISQIVVPIGICATLQGMGRLEASGVWTAILLGHMVLAAVALLAANPRPTEEEVRHALAGNLCRCTGYMRIFEAVLQACSTSAAP